VSAPECPVSASGLLGQVAIPQGTEASSAARVEVGYLRPFKRNLVDIFVSNDTLTYPLDTANELFLRLEERGHRVMLAIDQ
jgi:hypothetical protein